jgi:signal transduction histidine kinase
MRKLLKSAEFFKLQNDLPNHYYTQYKIGVCYYYINRREEAMKFMNEVIKNKQYVDEQLVINSYSNIGALQIEMGILNNNNKLLENSKIYLRKSIKLNRKNKNYTPLALNYSLLAESYNQLNDKEMALQLLDSAVVYANKDANKSQEGFALIKKAHILNEKKQFNKALNFINKAVKIYQTTNDIPTKIYAFVEKKKLLVSMKNYKEANRISDSIYSNSILNYDKRFTDGISEMEVKYKTAQKEREILEQRADIAEKGLQIQKRNYQLFGIIGFALLLGILGYLFYSQQKLKNKQLIKENTLKAALQKIETQNKLQEQRLRISRDLHDNIGAQLSFIISSIDNLKYISKNTSTEFKDKLTYISKFTSTTIDQLRDTIWAMNKNEISISDLQSRTLSFIEKAKHANDDANIIFVNEIKSDISFTSIKGMNIFRVVQESLNNALKYAKATKIIVHFTENANNVTLTIKDNGKGFDKETVSYGNGIQNMQDRMEEVKGTFKINSEINKGTSIEITCKKDRINKA